jgi:hypothetical protein
MLTVAPSGPELPRLHVDARRLDVQYDHVALQRGVGVIRYTVAAHALGEALLAPEDLLDSEVAAPRRQNGDRCCDSQDPRSPQGPITAILGVHLGVHKRSGRYIMSSSVSLLVSFFRVLLPVLVDGT